MSNFYDEWVGLWEKGVNERKKSKTVIHANELKWVRTRQDYKAALLIAPENGFKTLGGVTMRVEIAPGWKTGKHSHGEEALYVLSGSGFSIVNGQRFDWEEGACMRMPFGAVHQHFNVSDSPVQFYAAMAPHLEHYLNVCKVEHLEDCGELTSTEIDHLAGVSARGDHDEKGQRIVLHKKDAVTTKQGELKKSWMDEAPEGSVPQQMKRAQSPNNVCLMGAYDDFKGAEIEMTDIFRKEGAHASVKHAHMEAILYVLKGGGYVVVDGERHPIMEGSSIHVQGPQTVHQIFHETSDELQLLRTHFAIRKFIQPIAKDKFPYLYLEEGRRLEASA